MNNGSVQHSDCFDYIKAAVKLQKVYRSYRTRRRLADSAVVAEALWWQATEYARLNHSTIAFFNVPKPETITSRWSRISLNASKIGKGSSKDDKARKLAFQHWIEAIDPRHRYGHNLHKYYNYWSKQDTEQPFFYWLDVGEGKEVDLEGCPRSRLRQECIKYLGHQERVRYEYIVEEGKVVHKLTGGPLDTNRERNHSKWIFVMSPSRKLYAGEKKKGLFHHSSFLAGGTTLAAGRLTAPCGHVETVSAYSGHYQPNDENLSIFLSFLRDNNVNIENVKVFSPTEDYQRCDSGKFTQKVPETLEFQASSSLQIPQASQEGILQRMKSMQERISYQLGHELSLKWSIGAGPSPGPRIGFVADYPQAQDLRPNKISNQC